MLQKTNRNTIRDRQKISSNQKYQNTELTIPRTSNERTAIQNV